MSQPVTKSPSAYRRIEVSPLTGALGAEIRGVDLSSDLDDETFDEVRRAWLEHLVIFFRDQRLTPEQHLAFGRRFGTLNVHDFVPGLAGHPEIMEIVKDTPDRGYNFGGVWHSDVTYLEEPAMGSILYALETPPYGGDTLFANMYLAYESLSAGLRTVLDGLSAVHSARSSYSPVGRQARRETGSVSMKVDIKETALQETTHPVVRTHPETGRRLLYVNPNFAVRFAGMTEAESAPLLQYLYRHQQRPEFSCRFRWSPLAVAFWDNRCTQHFAINDYHGFRRRMHRVTVNGDRPH